MRNLDRLPAPNPVGENWLRGVRQRLDEPKPLAVAQEIARLVQLDGRGKLLSPIDLARPAGLSEDEVIEGVNRLIVKGLVVLRYRPMQRFLTAFFPAVAIR